LRSSSSRAVLYLFIDTAFSLSLSLLSRVFDSFSRYSLGVAPLLRSLPLRRLPGYAKPLTSHGYHPVCFVALSEFLTLSGLSSYRILPALFHAGPALGVPPSRTFSSCKSSPVSRLLPSCLSLPGFPLAPSPFFRSDFRSCPRFLKGLFLKQAFFLQARLQGLTLHSAVSLLRLLHLSQGPQPSPVPSSGSLFSSQASGALPLSSFSRIIPKDPSACPSGSFG
jgi:hypothetical protein